MSEQHAVREQPAVREQHAVPSPSGLIDGGVPIHAEMTNSGRTAPMAGGWRAAASSRSPLSAWVRRRRTAMIASDAMMLIAGGLVAVGLARGGTSDVGLSAVVYGLIAMSALALRGAYRPRLAGSLLPDLGRIITATALAAMVLVTVRSLAGDDVGTAALAAELWLCSSLLVSSGRAGLALLDRHAATKPAGGLPTVVLGAGRVGRVVAERLRTHPELGLRPLGHVDDAPRFAGDDDLPVLGRIDDLEQVAMSHEAGCVVIAFSRLADERLAALMRRCLSLGIEVVVVPRLYEEMSARLSLEYLGGVPLLRVDQPDPRGWQFAVKHALDRVIGAVLLLFCAPVLAVVAVAVRLSSPGPVLFRQRRVGRDGRAFTMFKFRTMIGEPSSDGEADASWAARERGEAHAAAPAIDRCTPVGRVLRQLSLDELPQLFNVLRGDMSLVGPRPERVGYVREFEDFIYRYADRHRVKPGVTGWAQVHGLRGDTSLSDRVEWDNFYIHSWSPRLDLRILLMTVPAALRTMRRST
jgi:exopolysaccharide biosynthesis polyprenyl glycosylphosphotransferase